ncbi:hypothetical protein [Streptomyces mexicanus]|uniref:hypothetical protein n=1 Tax=Streptomyces mexicanus TaxID=178566 RepID=UPI003F69953F
MAGFRSLARQVRDPRCDLALRRYSLRKCLERFAPYGHRATWDHLCSRAGFGPEDRSPDPARLVAALEELEEARAVWLDYEVEFARRRRKEKHDGLRRPGSVDDWHRLTWGGFGVAWGDAPRVHPSEPLAEVLRRRPGRRRGTRGTPTGCGCRPRLARGWRRSGAAAAGCGTSVWPVRRRPTLRGRRAVRHGWTRC